jgi:hypothetical protein
VLTGIHPRGPGDEEGQGEEGEADEEEEGEGEEDSRDKESTPAAGCVGDAQSPLPASRLGLVSLGVPSGAGQKAAGSA